MNILNITPNKFSKYNPSGICFIPPLKNILNTISHENSKQNALKIFSA